MLDLDVSKPYIADLGPIVYVDYPVTLTETKGNPRKLTFVTRQITRDFHTKNKRFKYMPDHYKLVQSPNFLMINNYNYLYKVYKYADATMTPYYRRLNILKTVIDKIEECAANSAREHFLFFNIPPEIPALSLLKIFEDGRLTPAIMKFFSGYDKMFYLEMWKWFTENRKNSVFNALSEETLIKTNIVLTAKDGRSVVFNLGYLNSWIEGNKNQTDAKSVMQLKPAQMQKLYLKLNLTLQASVPEESLIPLPSEEKEESQITTPGDDTTQDEDYPDDPDAGDNDENDEIDQGQFSQTVAKSNTATAPDQPTQADDLEDPISDTLDIESELKNLDEDINIIERQHSNNLKNRGLSVRADGTIEENATLANDISEDEVRMLVYENPPVEETLKEQIEKAADQGQVTAVEYRKLVKMAEGYKDLKDPYGEKANIQEAGKIAKEELVINAEKKKIETSHAVLDDSMKESTLQSFDSDYINNVLKKDIVSMTAGLQKAGVIIKSHDIEIEDSILGRYEKHTIEFKPIDGATSTIHFKIPAINEDGTFVANGNKYNMRKQRVDLPIRKINPTTVGLTSYYGKTFVAISPKKANNSVEWLLKKLSTAALNGDAHILKVSAAKVYDNNFRAPYIYSALSEEIREIQTTDCTLNFAHTERTEIVSEADVMALETNGARVCGVSIHGEPIVVDMRDQFYVYSKKILNPLGNIFDVLRLEEQDCPVDFAEARIFSKVVPVIIVLGYFLGMSAALKLLSAQYRFVEPRGNKKLAKHEYAITFRDGTYVFNKTDRIATTIIAGLNDYSKELKLYNFAEFNNRDVYLNILSARGMGAIYIRELDAINALFVDPITKGILEDMKEPTTYLGLLVRSVEMLQTYHHPISQDLNAQRIRGYERIAGVIYKQMAMSIRQYRSRNIAGKSKIEMSPYEIWNNILKDPAVKIVEDINPIQNLKEQEVVTYVGEGGRSKDSINKAGRASDESDRGVMSEATVDSGDVGVNAFLTANPNIINMRGIIRPRTEKDGLSNLLSTSALMSVGALHDDPKRVNFISIQQSHTVAAKGYHQAYVRTGYEYVIGNRTTEMFCYTAKQDGVVESITPQGIIIKYIDGTLKGISLGRQYGKAEGTIYPHDVVTPLKAGDSFYKGDVVCYNTSFFEEDILDPTKVVMKNSLIAKTVFYESPQTHEDSSSISASLSERLTSKTTKTMSFTVNFGQNLRDVVKVGDSIRPNDILMIIEDEITAGSYDEESIRVLRRLANQAPRSAYKGTVDKIEVRYHGEKADMSNTLKALADKSDKVLAATCKSSGKPVITGAVNDDYRVSGTPLTLDKAEIIIYITISTSAGVGDKAVFASQMKSVIGQVMDYEMYTESGEKIDAVFGFRSIMARIVNSPVLIATTTTLLKVIGRKAVEIYRSK